MRRSRRHAVASVSAGQQLLIKDVTVDAHVIHELGHGQRTAW